jgi:anti-sigma factor RsiW
VSDSNPIFSQQSGAVSEEQILAYLEGRLSPEAARAVEEALANEGLESDAVEGLQAMEAEEVKRMSARLNHELQRKLRSGKRVRRRGMDSRWALVAVLVVLLACILAYAVIHFARRPL